MDTKREIAVFGSGCFWCTEAVFKMFRGIISVLPGYSGGETTNPTYELVASGTTGHAEVARIEYDPGQISFHDLLTIFFASHDATSLNKQGDDVGPQYRSIILYTTLAQKDEAKKFIKELDRSSKSGDSIVTEVVPFKQFYPAENYHLNYFANHEEAPYCQHVIAPKLAKVQEQFANLLKTQGSAASKIQQ